MKDGKILIVDEAGQDVRLMAKVLNSAGYTMIREVSTTSEALQVCEEFRPHLVLLEVSSVGPDKVRVFARDSRNFRPGSTPLSFCVLSRRIAADAEARPGLGCG